MKPFAFAAVALLVLAAAPPAHAREAPDVPFPEELRALLPRWIQDAADAQAGVEGRPWANESDRYLKSARAAADQGRVRSVLYDLEAHRQIVETRRLLDDVAGEPSDGARKSRILAQADQWRAQSVQDWEDYRAALHAFDGRLQSARAVETALYSVDLALGGAIRIVEYPDLRVSFLRGGGVDVPLVGGLVLDSRIVSYHLRLARDVLDVAAGMEGVAPRLDAQEWSRLVNATLVPIDPETVVDPLRDWERLAGDARGRNEGLLAMGLHLAEVRELRLSEIVHVYSEAASRGRDVTADGATGLARAMENVTAEDALDAGLSAVYTADALDAGRHVLGLMPDAAIEAIMHAWARMDQQRAANAVLLEALPKTEEKGGGNGVPGPGVALVALALVAVAVLSGSRRRGAAPPPGR